MLEESPPPAAMWTCECGRTNPSDNFNCPSCGANSLRFHLADGGVNRLRKNGFHWFEEAG